MPALTGFRVVLTTLVPALALGLAPPLSAQSSDSNAPPPAAEPAPAPAPIPEVEPPIEPKPRINLMVTVPRGEVNQAQVQQCRNDADAGTIIGEIVVCGEPNNDAAKELTGSRKETQKRYAQETAFKGAPRTPEAFGIPNHGNSIGIGKVPPPALFIDVEALPTAPPGSDADRIGRGLAPTGQEEQLTEEQERARREAAGIKTTAPPRPKKKGG